MLVGVGIYVLYLLLMMLIGWLIGVLVVMCSVIVLFEGEVLLMVCWFGLWCCLGSVFECVVVV